VHEAHGLSFSAKPTFGTGTVDFPPRFNAVYAESAVAKYHFNVVDRQGVVSDEEGSDFQFFTEALREAKDSARDLAKHLLDSQTVLLEQCVEVTDNAGNVLAALPVVEVLRHPHFPKFQNHC
jgi:hypothetical protein